MITAAMTESFKTKKIVELKDWMIYKHDYTYLNEF